MKFFSDTKLCNRIMNISCFGDRARARPGPEGHEGLARPSRGRPAQGYMFFSHSCFLSKLSHFGSIWLRPTTIREFGMSWCGSVHKNALSADLYERRACWTYGTILPSSALQTQALQRIKFDKTIAACPCRASSLIYLRNSRNPS